MSICSCAEAAEPPPESKLPKAALQQLCQKQQWPPPKFDRLPPGGHRLAHAGIRYSVHALHACQQRPKEKEGNASTESFPKRRKICKLSLTSGVAIPQETKDSHQ